MNFLRKLLRFILILFFIPIIYLGSALILTAITIEPESNVIPKDEVVYLNTNGVHLDVVIPKHKMTEELSESLVVNAEDQYVSFGWGDENFYLNTPTWGDLTFTNAFSALFLESSTLMHITRYRAQQKDWIEVKLTKDQFQKLNFYIANSFKTNSNGVKYLLEGQGYSSRDEFYKANGSYSCFKTCNSWVNTGFKESEMKSCLWTPFDFGLMNKYE